MQDKPTSLVETSFVDFEKLGPSVQNQYLTSVDDPKSTFVAVIKAGEALCLDKFDRVDFFVLKGTLITKDSIVVSRYTLITQQWGDWPCGGEEGATVLVYAEKSPSVSIKNIVMTPDNHLWVNGAVPGMKLALLKTYPHKLMLIKWTPGTKVSHHEHPTGEEIFVLEGKLKDADWRGAKTGSWQRLKPGATHAPYTDENTLILLRQGHLGIQ